MPVIVPVYLRCEYLVNPLGIDVLQPRLSWIVDSGQRAQHQSAYQILVASSEKLLSRCTGDLWDTGKVESDQSTHITYKGSALRSQMPCYWKVRIWDKDGSPGDWSAPAFFSMGLLDHDEWSAKWIGASPVRFRWLRRKLPKRQKPCPLLRRSFNVKNAPERAMIYVTALGEYELRLNGERVGDRLLAPEWIDYDFRVQYQTYDVTGLLQAGENVLGAVLGEGWYAGHNGLDFPFKLYNHSVYGQNLRLLLKMVIEYAGGTKEEIVSDEAWKLYLDGPIRKSDHFKGETYDAGKEVYDWDRPGFNDSSWAGAVIDSSISKTLVSQMNEPIRKVKEILPVAVSKPRPGLYIFNLGQNITGWCKIRLSGKEFKPNSTVKLKHAEMLKDDGTLYRSNLKLAFAVDTYRLQGAEKREYQPHFTYHGFQYVSVDGLKDDVTPSPDLLSGCAIASDTPLTGGFECSDPHLNQLWNNILWTQRNNLISVPTDCPQRDERLGWMADAHIFCQSSIYNMDMAAFYTKWIRDIRDAQFPNGSYSDISPNTRKRGTIYKMGGAPAWADAGIFIPWCVYLNYNDKRLLEQHFESAKRYIDYIRSKNPSLIWREGNWKWGIQYNDWLNGDTIKAEDYPKEGAEIPREVFATCFFARSTELFARMAKVLDRKDEHAFYSELAGKIRRAFVREFMDEAGRIRGNNQAAYALALHFDMLPGDSRELALQYLLEAIDRYGGRISTGICTTLPMMLELTRNGQNEVAYKLLQSRRFPSWYYMIEQGATTMWERWDGYVKGRGFQSWLMNSFNHYSIGAIGEWIYRVILGINPDEDNPGFKQFIIRPRPGGTLTWAKGHYKSIHGTIEVSWRIIRNCINIELTVPANTTATIHIPAASFEDVTEGGTPLRALPDIRTVEYGNNTVKCLVASGAYHFHSRI